MIRQCVQPKSRLMIKLARWKRQVLRLNHEHALWMLSAKMAHHRRGHAPYEMLLFNWKFQSILVNLLIILWGLVLTVWYESSDCASYSSLFQLKQVFNIPVFALLCLGLIDVNILLFKVFVAYSSPDDSWWTMNRSLHADFLFKYHDNVEQATRAGQFPAPSHEQLALLGSVASPSFVRLYGLMVRCLPAGPLDYTLTTQFARRTRLGLTPNLAVVEKFKLLVFTTIAEIIYVCCFVLVGKLVHACLQRVLIVQWRSDVHLATGCMARGQVRSTRLPRLAIQSGRPPGASILSLLLLAAILPVRTVHHRQHTVHGPRVLHQLGGIQRQAAASIQSDQSANTDNGDTARIDPIPSGIIAHHSVHTRVSEWASVASGEHRHVRHQRAHQHRATGHSAANISHPASRGQLRRGLLVAAASRIHWHWMLPVVASHSDSSPDEQMFRSHANRTGSLAIVHGARLQAAVQAQSDEVVRNGHDQAQGRHDHWQHFLGQED